MSATAVGKPRNEPRKPLPRRLQQELDTARGLRDLIVVAARSDYFRQTTYCDGERKRIEREAWEQYRAREAEIRERAELGPDLVASITKTPTPAPRPAILTRGVPAPRRRWWHRLRFWRRG